MDNNFLTVCPVDCDEEFVWPAFDENQDCDNYDLLPSQISSIIIQPPGAPNPFADWATTPTLVSGAIDNTVSDNTKCRWLVGIGGVSDPEPTLASYPLFKVKRVREITTLTLRVLNLINQYEGLRKLGCSTTDFKFWFTDMGGYVYGLQSGIDPRSIMVKSPSGAGETDTKEVILEIAWQSKGGLPERRANPLA